MKREKAALLLALPFSLTLSLVSIFRYLLIIHGGTPSAVSSLLSAFFVNAAAGIFILEKQREKNAPFFRTLSIWAGLSGIYTCLFPLLFKSVPVIESAINSFFLPIGFSFLLTFVPSAAAGMTIHASFITSFTNDENLSERAPQKTAVVFCVIALAIALACWVLLKTLGVLGVLFISGVILLLCGGVLFQSVRLSSKKEEVKQGVKTEKKDIFENLSPNKVEQITITAAICLWYSFVSFEIYISRGFALTVSNSAFVYTLILICLFIGLAVGFFLHQKFFVKARSQVLVLGLVLFGMSLTQLLTSANMTAEIHTKSFFISNLLKFSLKTFSDCLAGVALASLAFLKKSTSHHNDFKEDFLSLCGAVIAASGGVFSAIFLFIPAIGSQKGALVSAAVCAVGGLAVTPASGRKYKWSAALAASALVCASAVPAARPWEVIPPASDYLYHSGTDKNKKSKQETNNILLNAEDSSAWAVIAVTPDNKDFFLTVNGVVSSSTTQNSLMVEYMMGHLPALLHGVPSKSALIGGVGGGISCGALASHGGTVYCVEPSKSVLKASSYFYSYNNGFSESPAAKLIKDDGRHFILTQPPSTFDIIVVNSSFVRSFFGANYYSLDFYRLCSSRLKEGGILCQRLPLGGLSENELRSLLATFQSAFPDASLWTAYLDVLLIGVKGKANFNLDDIEKNFSAAQTLQNDFKQSAIGSGAELMGRLLLGPVQIHNLHRSARVVTDNRNILQFFIPFSPHKNNPAAENWRWLSQARSDEIEAFVSGSKDAFKRFRTSRTASVLATEGWFLMKEGRKNDAVGLFETAIKIHSDNQTARRLLSEIILEPVDSLVNQGKFSEAKLLVYRALDAYPDNPIALRWMAHQVAQSGDLGYARNLLDKAKSLAPYNPDILGDLAVVLFQLGRRDEALDMVQRALIYGQNSATPYFAMGVIKEFSGERNEAAIYYRKALARNPEMVEAIKRLEVIENSP